MLSGVYLSKKNAKNNSIENECVNHKFIHVTFYLLGIYFLKFMFCLDKTAGNFIQ
jgi:hypothetical protein